MSVDHDQRDGEMRSPLIPDNNSTDSLSTGHLRQRQQQQQQRRILDRNAAFRQSHGELRVQRLSRRRNRCFSCSRLWNEWIFGDWFHRLAYQRTLLLMLILFLIYTSMVVFFAFVYLGVSILGQKIEKNDDGTTHIVPFCHMGIDDHMEALYFSLSTMTTIGYGVSDYYFGGCWTPLLLVLWQVCCAITFDAVAVGLLFHRISRGSKRGKTILFSDKAIVKRVKGIPYIMFRIGELRRYQLIEATVRCYCVRHERIPKSTSNSLSDSNGATDIETTHFVSRQIKLIHPDENYGSNLWMGLPQIIVHRMDDTSPLMPPLPVWYDAQGGAHSGYDHTNSMSSSQKAFMLDRDMEIIVLVQGVDEATGATTQARHSYTASDLAWDHTFVPCVRPRTNSHSRRRNSSAVEVDFSVFHDVAPVAQDCDACPYLPLSENNFHNSTQV